MRNLTHKEILLIGHSIGVDVAKAVLSNKKGDKQLPEEFYRNYFNTSKGTIDYPYIVELIRAGFMEYRKGTNYYHVTKEGIDQFKKQFLELAIYKRPHERDRDYLKHQINFYCRFYNYQLGDDPAEWVFEDFQKYFWDKSYMSHTMTDITNRFKTQLKKLFPKPIKSAIAVN